MNQQENYDQEGPTQDVWHLIAYHYFPQEEPTAPNSQEWVTWAVIREGYRRGVQDASLNKPDVIAIKTKSTMVMGGGIQDDMRDMLTIECKRPKDHTQSGWQRLLEESIDRLRRYSAQQSTFLIAAVGSFYMYFFWNHEATNSMKPLTILVRNGRRTTLDRRLRPLGRCPWLPNLLRPDGRRSRPEMEMDIDHEGAYSILGDMRINPYGLLSLENFLTAVRGSQLTGRNVFI